MNGRILLDTPIVIALFAKESPIQERLTQAAEVFIPSIVLGELYYGARKSVRLEVNLERIDELASTTRVLACNTDTAKQYGQIKQALKAKGRPLPENDIWIAAVAIQYGLTVVSRDDHFYEVDGLLFEKW
jgi:tRNA(fMet)-specific endonuclease VapC